MTPPVIMSFIRSGPVSDIFLTSSAASSGDLTTVAMDPAKCPPGTEMPVLDAMMRGPVSFPSLIRSRTCASKSSTPPTVLIVVTPLITSVFA